MYLCTYVTTKNIFANIFSKTYCVYVIEVMIHRNFNSYTGPFADITDTEGLDILRQLKNVTGSISETAGRIPEMYDRLVKKIVQI